MEGAGRLEDFFSKALASTGPASSKPGATNVSAQTTSSSASTQEDTSAPPKKLRITASNGQQALARLKLSRPRAAIRMKVETVEVDLIMNRKVVGSTLERPKKEGEVVISSVVAPGYPVFKLLMPTDILNLSRTTKALRAVLLHRSAKTVWMASLRHLRDFPACPDDMSLPAWTSLLLDTYCQNCLDTISIPDFVLRMRCCIRCSSFLLVPLFTYPKMHSILEKAVPATHWNDDKQLLAIKKEVETFLAKWKTRTVLGDQLTDERAAVALRKAIGKKAKTWYDNRAEERADELDRIKDERAADIQTRLTTMGYASELAFLLQFRSVCVIDPLPQDVPDFYQHYHVDQSRPLTDRVWGIIKTDMVQLMLRMREHIQANDRCIIIRARRKVMHLLYLRWRNRTDTLDKYPAYYLMPGPVDILEHYKFAATLDMPSSVKLHGARDTAVPAPLLWYPAFLTHPCGSVLTHERNSMHPKPASNLSLNATYQYHDCVWGTSIYQQAWAPKSMVFDAAASKTVGHILEACGMSKTTTVEELDTIDPRVACLRCSFGAKCDGKRLMRIFGWREAVNHSMNNHFGNCLVKWECLTPEDTVEAKRLEAIKAVKQDFPTTANHRVWCCTTCRHHAHDPGRMTWTGLQSHFDRNPTHGIVEDMDEDLNRRYFRDPEMTRRALPRITMAPGKVPAPTTPEPPA